MSLRHALVGSLALTLLLACGQARQPRSQGAEVPACARCHGGVLAAGAGTDPLIFAAPPRAIDGSTTGPGVGAHALHLATHVSDGNTHGPVACQTCHLVPTSSEHPRQAAGKLTFSGLAVTAWAGATAPTPTFAGGTCASTYCHGAFRSGNAANAPAWAAPRAQSCGTCHGDPATGNPLPAAHHPPLAAGATCGACHPQSVGQDGKLLAGGRHLDGAVQTDPAAVHPAGWSTPGDPAFHGPVAAQNARACQRCHASQAPATVAAVTCADCHAQKAGGLCSDCHGSGANAAPPVDLAGNSSPSALGVGAHQAHLTAPGGYAAPLTCAFCHATPSDLFSAGHLDGQVTVTGYTGTDATWRTAVQDPGWSAPTAATASCATAYCHGAFPGGSGVAPLWTQAGQVSCGSCHALPPPAPHPAVTPTRLACSLCHPDTVNAAGDLVPIASGGTHLDGRVQVLDQHAASWMDPASSNFHALAANRGLTECAVCHGADLSGGYTGVSCASCHDASLPAGVASWKVNCVMCHGGTDNPTGAPPRSTWGTGNEAVRVGAHTAHLSAGVACSDCHVVPADALAAGHLGASPAEVAFSGMATFGGATPTWNRTTSAGTCASTYCHASPSLTGGGVPAPDWTRTGQAGCGGCHGVPPGVQPVATHPTYLFNAPCIGCHPASTDVGPSGANIIRAGGSHLDGAAQSTFAGHPVGWAEPGFGGYIGGSHSNQVCLGCGATPGAILMGTYCGTGPGGCVNCHGRAAGGECDLTPDGGSSRVSCGACHAGFFTAGAVNCNFCH